MITCSRSGCDKKLRSNNTTGACATGCLSMEAPPARRAKGVGESAPPAESRPKPATPRAADERTQLERFRLVAEALGQDADALLEAFAGEWLNSIRTRIEED